MTEGFKSEWEEKVVKFAEAHPDELWSMLSKLSPEAQETKDKREDVKSRGGDPTVITAEVERIMAAASPEVQAELRAHSDEFRDRVNKHATVLEHIPARSGSSIPFFNLIYRNVTNKAKRRGAEALLLHRIAKDLTEEKPRVCTCYHDGQPAIS
ncbi:hypothetical protein PRIPAC_97665 [Pristionchus pacificus]|uniref:Uncharacterized protein n=1 Tax=Pristionchus pacificus TaxID=54126 RepID=A0A2A6D1C2_PRIPA|nr:hypothetical protein PRIPAC_97665 [Pristionchus pacificus]|eukprot:PDM84180.1 hypothetical protein PRIPAC_33203 [Pristionchus pacificus]